MSHDVPERISGLIERVTYFAEETGFAVLKVAVKGRPNLVTVVGSAPVVNPGEWVSAEGRWVFDKQHGEQFKSDKLHCVPPSSAEGIKKYLGSGMVKGIGPVYAQKLVDAFGTDVLDIIENFSARLEEVNGIGPGRRKKIKDAWQEQKHVRDIMVFLHANGVSTSRAFRIYKTYGEEAIGRVRANPYALAQDISGIGFKTADEIARRIGIPADSILRACAGIRHALVEATGSGHCALPETLLKDQARELLSVTEEKIAEGLTQLLAQKELLIESIDGELLVFLPALQKAEETIAARIRSLAAQAPCYPPIDIPKAILWCQTRLNLQLAPAQIVAIEKALQHRLMIITGGPGVGKTTLLRALLAILAAKNVKVLLCAPTGRAAQRLAEATGHPAKTIHRLLEVRGREGGFARNRESPLEADAVIVDECSMVDVLLMNNLLKAHPSCASLILVGDADQLPSVGPGNVLKDLIASRVATVVCLTEVFRQAAHSQIVTASHAINRGELPPPALQDADFHFIERESPEQILATLISTIKRRLPAKFEIDPRLDIQVLSPMHRGSLGTRELNLALQEALNGAVAGESVVERFGWQFRMRDKIIQTSNNYEKEVFNGDIGQIKTIDPVEREIVALFDRREVIYSFDDLDEIALAYAISIHKSQGSEFPIVVIPIAAQHFMLLQRNLLYTAMTRGKKFVVVIGQRQAFVRAIRNSEVSKRFTGLLFRLKREEFSGADAP